MMDPSVEPRTRLLGRILVVDDEPAVRRVLDKLLVREGYEVVHASDGDNALEILRRSDIDTVLLDVLMPGMTGLEVCRRMREEPLTRHTPVVFLTAHNDRSFRREARDAGADDFLSKPFDEVELIARVRNTVKLKNYHDELHRERKELLIAYDGRTRALSDATAKLEKARLELEQTRVEILDRLARAAEFRDDETAAHLHRMAAYSQLLGRKYGLPEDLCEMLRMASPMHDVGKIGVPDQILLKPSGLSAEEFEIMKQHAEIGYQILSGSHSDLLKLAAVIAHSHHEKWDGSGYPQGLAGEQIPIAARIVAVADVFDALTTRRPYKNAWSFDETRAYMLEQSGTHFDPDLVGLFLSSMDELATIHERYRDEGD